MITSFIRLTLFGVGFLTLFTGHQTSASGYGSDMKTTCTRYKQVLGALFAADNKFAAGCTDPLVCNKYFPTCLPGGACNSHLSYVRQIREYGGTKYVEEDENKGRRRRRRSARNRSKRGVHGALRLKCCKLQEPAGETLHEFCESYNIEHDDEKKADLFNGKGTIGEIGGDATRYVKYISKIPSGYNVKICYIQCDEDTTTRRPTTEGPELPHDILGENFVNDVQQASGNQHSPPAVEHAGTGGEHCFPEDGIVLTPEGPRRMDQLRVGDKVQAHSDWLSGQSYETVTYFMHREPDATAEFLEFTTGNGFKVQMTPGHMIPVISCEGEDLKPGNDKWAAQMRPANKVSIGSCVLVEGSENRIQPVVSITRLTRRGIYNPVTVSGTIVVNGVHCGVYVESSSMGGHRTVRHMLGMSMFKLLDGIQSITGSLWDIGHEFKEMPNWLLVTMEAVSIV